MPLDMSPYQQDAVFLVSVAENLALEIEMGQLAQLEGQDEEVRALGKMMEVDHSRHLVELLRLANSKLISIPSSPSRKAQLALEKLMEMDDDDFAENYCMMVIQSHIETIGLFEQALFETTDRDIRVWSEKVLPAFKRHLEHALACEANRVSI